MIDKIKITQFEKNKIDELFYRYTGSVASKSKMEKAILFYGKILRKLISDKSLEITPSNPIQKDLIDLAKKYKEWHIKSSEESNKSKTDYVKDIKNLNLHTEVEKAEKLDRKEALNYFSIPEDVYERNEKYKTHVNSEQYRKQRLMRKKKQGKFI